jgi:hypothetical protein
MSGARGVPSHPLRLRLRLQMYPRVEHLLVVPLLLVVWAMLSFGGDGYRGVPWVALLSGLAMWVMVPEIGRYRAFGLPLRYWTRDAAAAVLVGAALFCTVGGRRVHRLAGLHRDPPRRPRGRRATVRVGTQDGPG